MQRKKHLLKKYVGSNVDYIKIISYIIILYMFNNSTSKLTYAQDRIDNNDIKVSLLKERKKDDLKKTITKSILSFFVVPSFLKSSVQKVQKDLIEKYGVAHQKKIEQGVAQVANYWNKDDGDSIAFERFVLEHYVADESQREYLFSRMQYSIEQLYGHFLEVSRTFSWQSDLDLGALLPVDDLMSTYDPFSHIVSDLFSNKIAFSVLLNFPLATLEEKTAIGPTWTRRHWAEVRLAEFFSRRIPSEVNQGISVSRSETQKYISEYNIWMHHIVDEKQNRYFPAKLRLITHWNLRDELKALYANEDSLKKQSFIAQIMERIVTQTIPKSVVNNPRIDWNPFTNKTSISSNYDFDTKIFPETKLSEEPEPDTRYEMFLKNFHSSKKADAHHSMASNLIDRRFNEDRELSETRVKEMLESVLTSPLVSRVANLIESRLKRPLEPFDIWYDGFKPRQKYTEDKLDAIVKDRYPNVESFSKDIPRILTQLGFSKDRADYLSSKIVVDPSRGAGHAMGAGRKEDSAHLRTRFEKGGMNYKGYNIAIHEMGHNVEQIFSLNFIDHYTISGVPNNAFTEAIAFVFQGRDLELLGLEKPDTLAKALLTLNDFWATYEIAGVAMVDIEAWHWMYEHPNATPSELREAVVKISKNIWNTYYSTVFKKKDSTLLGIYSHMIDEMLYLPDYPIGHLIAFQIEEQIEKTGHLASEIERISKIGKLAPDVWMKQASGYQVSAEPLLRAVEKSLKSLESMK